MDINENSQGFITSGNEPFIEISREKDYNGSRWIYYGVNSHKSMEFFEKKDIKKTLKTIITAHKEELNGKEIEINSCSIKLKDLEYESIPDQEIINYINYLKKHFPNIQLKKGENKSFDYNKIAEQSIEPMYELK